MSHLIPDFVLNPVLRQARRFSRANPNEDLDPETRPQSDLDSNDGTAIAGITEQEGSVERAEAGAGESPPIDSRATWSLREEQQSSGGVEERVENRPSPPPATFEWPQMAPGQMNPESGRINTEPATDPSHSSRDASGEVGVMDGPSRPPSEASSQSEPSGRDRKNTLPADDGMGALREQILQIQSQPVSMEQKAQWMHRLMAERYYRSQEISSSKEQPRAISPEDIISQPRPPSAPSLSSILWHMNGVVDDLPEEEQYTFHLTPGDLMPTYAPLRLVEGDEDSSSPSNETTEEGEEHVSEDEDGTNTEEESDVLGCQHYQRNVKLQCSTCDRWYTCRLCHDEVEDHILIRRATKNMLCMLCGSAQRAGEFCVNCGERTAWYYCDVCKLWDNDARKSIYHCNDCGICRKGRGLGKDFFHCKRCDVCMPMAVENDHKCIERASDCNCPICGEHMFHSPRSVVFMLCGHGIHQTCYHEHQKTSYKCPICNKSTINMEAQFLSLDRAIQSQPMPPEFRDTQATVSCNDCYAKSIVKYHWLGLKCAICNSYNTAQLSILSSPDAEAPPVQGGEENRDVPEQIARDHSSSTLLVPGSSRTRRHSSYMYQAEESSEGDGITHYPAPQRIARSVSPMNRRGFLDSFAALFSGDTDDSEFEDDDLDFWGREGPRSTTTVEHTEDDIEDLEESDSDDEEDDCDGDDEEDEFELLGHR